MFDLCERRVNRGQPTTTRFGRSSDPFIGAKVGVSRAIARECHLWN